MKHKKKYLYLILLLWAFAPILGQNNGNFTTLPFNIDSILAHFEFNPIHFMNIGKKTYFKDKSQLKKIQSLKEKGEDKKRYELLKNYISQFGIQNFYTDTQLIWQLAKLSETYGSEVERNTLFRMVLRHHHKGIEYKDLIAYYDSLNQQKIDEFVNLDTYLSLVEDRKLIDTLRPPHGVLLNIGRHVNSDDADYAPTLNIGNNILFFTSKRNKKKITFVKDEEFNEDVFISRLTSNNHWELAEPFDAINTQYNEGSMTISKDGKTIIFSRCESLDGFGDCDLYLTHLQNDSTWTVPRNLGKEVNSEYWDSHPSLSHEGDTLYFASDRKGGFGLSDIYFTYQLKNNHWAKAQNLGPIINTRNNEVSPFFHPKYQVLYFSSNGQIYNFGEFDIFKSYKIGVSWTEPYNIGPLVNGSGSEFYFTIDSHSDLLFYARSITHDLNKLDIYSFPLPMSAQPTANVNVSGSLVDSLTGTPFAGIVSIIDLDNGIEVAPKYLNKDGSFNFNLINNNNYLLIIQGDNFFRVEELFYLDGKKEIHKTTQPLASRISFESIEFELNDWQLTESMYPDLNKIVNFLYDNPDFKLKISGHTDAMGDPDDNLKLSKNRAKSIFDYIVDFAGVDADRVAYEGYGHTKPILENAKTEKERNINRRVDFYIFR